ncbi:hypothetical protein EHS25_008456 [Saitozyma podzolica]|uniref:Uncharacterized protein n=1 Tax=Saitozyma podzolica TaxID=1890683 RepID=A0A427YPG7_9TREE|nr:hypothetical protein EHS25_008456 [Saitozyma podzolica]
MPLSSDSFDDDDLFDDPAALDAIAAVEAQAISASQATKPHATQGYHHTVSLPRVGSSKPVPPPAFGVTSKGKARDPVPINTEPRVSTGGFGWGDGGKHFFPGNMERIITAGKQQRFREGYDDDDLPEIMMDDSGRYGFLGGAEEEVVDNHARAVSESLAAKAPIARPVGDTSAVATAAAVRRLAIRAAMDGTARDDAMSIMSRSVSADSKGPATSNQPRPPLAPLQQQPLQAGPSRFGAPRSLSRSVSAGSHIFARPAPTSSTSRLEPILSQSQSSQNGDRAASQGPPASQGAAARRAVFELDEERRKRDDLERQLDELKAQAASHQGKGKGRALWEGGEEVAEGDGTDADMTKKIKELQTELWRAKGEAESVRRAQRDEHDKHLAEAEKLRSQLADMQKQLRERENEAARQVENLKTQAVFNNHAVYNSAVKVRQFQASQRPLPTPIKNGSPSRKGVVDREITPLFHSAKGKAKAPAIGPGFKGFVNAFGSVTPTTDIRAKRQRTDAPSPTGSPARSPSKMMTPGRLTPTASPTGSKGARAGPGGHADMVGQEDNWAQPDFGMLELEPTIDHRGELLFHLFNHVPTSPIQFALGMTTQPTIYRILNYRPSGELDPDGNYAARCSDILRSCGDAQVEFKHLLGVLGRCLVEMLHICSGFTIAPGQTLLMNLVALINVLDLLSSITLLFPPFAGVMSDRDVAVGETCSSLARRLHELNQRKDFDAMISNALHDTAKAAPTNVITEELLRWDVELGQAVARLAEALCCFGDGRLLWKAEDLVDMIACLTSSTLDVSIVSRGVDLFYIAACHAENFRLLIGPSALFGDAEQPVLDRMARYLLDAHPTAAPHEALRMAITIARAFCMLAIAEFDAVLLIAERSALVPVLVLVLYRESDKIWGVKRERFSFPDALALLEPTLVLLHHLVFPAPFTKPPLPFPRATALAQDSQSVNQAILGPGPDPEPDSDAISQGINLPGRLHAAAQTKEFNGVHHVFQAALGPMAFADVDLEDEMAQWSVLGEKKNVALMDLRTIQYLSQDLIEATVEGPEQDAIYEVYAGESDPMDGGDDKADENEDGEDGVDPDAYAAWDVEDDYAMEG